MNHVFRIGLTTMSNLSLPTQLKTSLKTGHPAINLGKEIVTLTHGKFCKEMCTKNS